MVGDGHVCPVAGTAEEARGVLGGADEHRAEGPGPICSAVPASLGMAH